MLDATPFGPDANSYIDLATANSMATSVGLTKWAALSDGDKTAGLIRATLDVDSHHFHHNTPWNIQIITGLPIPITVGGIPVSQVLPYTVDLDPQIYVKTQALAFPRRIDRGVIPNPVKWAQLYQAEFIACSGEYDRKQWDGANAAPLTDSKIGSPLCPRALTMIAKFISRAGGYSG